MTDRYELECMGETVTMIVDDDGRVTLEGYDSEAEEAALAMGFERSTCSKIMRVIADAQPPHNRESVLDSWLVDAARDNDVALVSALIAMGADYTDERAYLVAVSNGHVDTVRLFLDLGMDPGSGAVHIIMAGWGAEPSYDCLSMLMDEMGRWKEEGRYDKDDEDE